MDYHITFDDGTSAYLAHHGVLGMKWGVWNAETRARYLGFGKRQGAPETKSASSAGKSGMQGLTDQQKKALKIAAGVAAVGLVAGVSIYAAKKKGLLGAGKSSVERVLDNTDSDPFAENLPKIDPDGPMESHLKACNPLMGSYGHCDNCTACTATLEMRLRGYDVEAVEMEDGQSPFEFARAFKDVKIHGIYEGISEKHINGLKQVLDNSGSAQEYVMGIGKYLMSHPTFAAKLVRNRQHEHQRASEYFQSQPDGARGNLIFVYPLGGAHSVFWRKEGESTVIYDGQSGERYRNPWRVLSQCSTLSYFRTDDKEVNWDKMKTTVRAHNPYYDDLPYNRKVSANTGYDKDFKEKMNRSESL